MKNKLLILLSITLLLLLILSSCIGDLAVTDIKITGGMKLEYTLGEKPDFSSVTATVHYNDGSIKEVTGKDLTFGDIDTSTIGTKQLTVSYGGYTVNTTVTVVGKTLVSGGQIITAVSLPDSLALWEINKADFINKSYGYVVGADNPFYLTLKLSVYSAEGEKLDVTSYTSVSTVTLLGSDKPLNGDDLSEYVFIDEDKNSFDFTDAAIGKTFIIATRPKDVTEEDIAEMTKTLTVTVVDGYNIYEAYELNYITNNEDAFDFSDVDSSENRTQYEIVVDFLKNEKNVTHPGKIGGIVLHKNLIIETTDIPREYFLDKDRSKDLYDNFSIFDNATDKDYPSFTIHGNYFSVYSYDLPSIVALGYGNQTNQASNTSLFSFKCNAEKDKNFDHTKYSVNIENLMLVDDAPQSDNLQNSDKALLGIIGFKTHHQVINISNTKIQSFFISFMAETDYQTVNITECSFINSWQNHLQLASRNMIQDENDEPLSKDKYPRLTVNITKSKISQCGGPAIIILTESPEELRHKNSGPVVNISKDSVIESWVTGEEAWFESLGISAIAQQVKNFDKKLQTIDSTFIKEEVRLVNGKPTTFKLVNIIAVNLLVPDLSLSVGEIFGQIQGKVDIDGKLIYGNKVLIDMDDADNGNTTSGFTNPTISDLKAESSGNHVLATPDGGIGCLGTNHPFEVVEGDLAAKSHDDFLTVYFYSMALVFGNYHPII